MVLERRQRINFPKGTVGKIAVGISCSADTSLIGILPVLLGDFELVCANDCPVSQLRKAPFRHFTLDRLEPSLGSFLRKSKRKQQK